MTTIHRRPGRHTVMHTHMCVCGKRAYSNKKRAKRAARQAHPAEQLSAYECRRSTAVLPAWHYGHLRSPRAAEGRTP